jgi:hypothetical protein
VLRSITWAPFSIWVNERVQTVLSAAYLCLMTRRTVTTHTPVSAGSYIDLSPYVTHHISSTALDLRSNSFNASLQNLLYPLSSGTADIVSTMGNMQCTVPVTIAGDTSIAKITLLEKQFPDKDVDVQDPSQFLCSSTFRGYPGDEASVYARFMYSQHDGLACPFVLPLGNLMSQVPPLHNMSVIIDTIQTSDTLSVRMTQDRNLMLVQSSVAELSVNATVSAFCVDPGSSSVSDHIFIHANIEAEDYQFDVGHRCGSPISHISSGSQRELRVGDSEWLPMRFTVPANNSMQALTVAMTYDDEGFVIVKNVSDDGALEYMGYIEPTLGTENAANFGDTNAVRYNSVWKLPTEVIDSAREPPQQGEASSVIVFSMLFQVRAP